MHCERYWKSETAWFGMSMVYCISEIQALSFISFVEFSWVYKQTQLAFREPGHS